MQEKRSFLIERLLSGSFDSFEEYKFISGKLKGMNDSWNIFINLYKDMYNLSFPLSDQINEEYASNG
jgi:hypothetical protein